MRLIRQMGDTMGNIGYIFGYAVIFAFLVGAVVGYSLKWLGDKDVS